MTEAQTSSQRVPTWLKLAITLLFAIVILELLLQVLSIGAHFVVGKGGQQESAQSGAELDAALAEGQRVAVCVGDSFTFGMGASDLKYSYPAEMERRLEEARGEDWKVVKVCYPGWNSEQMAGALLDRLDELKPDVVVLVGAVNDGWSGAKKVEMNSAEGLSSGDSPATKPGYRFQWRLAKLFRTLRQGNAFGNRDADSQDITDREKSVLPPIDEPSPQAIPDDLEAASHATPPPDDMMVFWQLMEEERFAEAEELYHRLPDGPRQSDPSYRVAMVRCYQRLGKLDQMRTLVDGIRAEYEADPTEEWGERMLDTLRGAWMQGEMLTTARELAVRFPDNFNIAFSHGIAAHTAGDLPTSRGEFIRAAELLGDEKLTHPHAAWFWESRTTVFAGTQDIDPVPEEMALSLVCSRLGGQDDGTIRRWFLQTREIIDRDLVIASLERVGVDPNSDKAKSLLAIHAQANEDTLEQRAAEVTRHNLGVMATAAKAQGALVLISTYPFDSESLAAAGKAASRDHKTLFLRIDDEFLDIVNVEGRDALFVADGHCNDRGYGMMGEMIATRLLTALAERDARLNDAVE